MHEHHGREFCEVPIIIPYAPNSPQSEHEWLIFTTADPIEQDPSSVNNTICGVEYRQQLDAVLFLTLRDCSILGRAR